MRQTAKIFTNGGSQAVRLPAEFRFTSAEVFIRKDSRTGEVILTEKPQTWDDFFAARDAAGAAGELDQDLLDFDERKRRLPRPDPFAGLEE